jgi:hypothetical protein
MACLLAAGFLRVAPVAHAASAGQPLLHPGENARTHVIEIGRRGRDRRIHLPVGPSYLYYDYPYYYSRGYYPTHIGPGYVYDFPYDYGRVYYPRYSGRCSYWHRRCRANGGDRDGCMEYHGC